MPSSIPRSIFPLILVAALGLMPGATKAAIFFTFDDSSVIAELFVDPMGSPETGTTALFAGSGQGPFALKGSFADLTVDLTLTTMTSPNMFNMHVTGMVRNDSTVPFERAGVAVILFGQAQGVATELQPLQLRGQLSVDGNLNSPPPPDTQVTMSAKFEIFLNAALALSAGFVDEPVPGQGLPNFTAEVNGDSIVDAADFDANARIDVGFVVGSLPPDATVDFGTNSLDLTITLQPIPEPSVWLMLGAGLAVVSLRLIGAGRKRRSLPS